MTDEQKVALKKFLYAVKASVMNIDINEDNVEEVYNAFMNLLYTSSEEEGNFVEFPNPKEQKQR